MPRVDHVWAYSCMRSEARRGMAPSEWLIMWTADSRIGNSLRQLRSSSIHVHFASTNWKVMIEDPAATAICCLPFKV